MTMCGPSVPRSVAGIVCARLAVNGGIRVVYPFMAVVAQGLGVSFGVVALLVASRSLSGLAGPAIARCVSPRHRRGLMLASQAILIVGCLLIVAAAALPAAVRTAAVGMGFVATGLARPLFDLPMQAWISAHVPAAARGRAFGVTELGWALSLGVSVPIADALSGRLGWRSPFAVVVGLACVGVLALLLTVPADHTSVTVATDRPVQAPGRQPRTARGRGRARRLHAAVLVCAGAGLVVAAGELLLVVYAQWMTRDLGLSAAQIGASTLLIVVAELTGEGLIVAVADRAGLRRTLRVALLASVATYVALGLAGHRIGVALIAVVVLFVAFEVTVVGVVALVSTITDHPPDRARLLGTLMAAIACGNAAGAVLAPLMFARGGMVLSAAMSGGLAVVGTTLLWRPAVAASSIAPVVSVPLRPALRLQGARPFVPVDPGRPKEHRP